MVALTEHIEQKERQQQSEMKRKWSTQRPTNNLFQFTVLIWINYGIPFSLVVSSSWFLPKPKPKRIDTYTLTQSQVRRSTIYMVYARVIYFRAKSSAKTAESHKIMQFKSFYYMNFCVIYSFHSIAPCSFRGAFFFSSTFSVDYGVLYRCH